MDLILIYNHTISQFMTSSERIKKDIETYSEFRDNNWIFLIFLLCVILTIVTGFLFFWKFYLFVRYSLFCFIRGSHNQSLSEKKTSRPTTNQQSPKKEQTRDFPLCLTYPLQVTRGPGSCLRVMTLFTPTN